MSRIYDITQTLHAGLPVWPGDTAFVREDSWVIGPDCPVKVSRLTLSTHSGSHADAPEHYHKAGSDIAGVDLAPYLGPCVLVTAKGSGPAVRPEDVDLDALKGAKRVLIRTYKEFPHTAWDSDFRAISPELIEALGRQGCLLIGTDAASLDPETSKTLDAHHAVRRHDMRILEGLVLDGVPDGRFELIALPLPIADADASPVRAILRDLPDDA
ncbi:arylformamidase [Maricaulis sp.]|uniref:arylformamidase n=1 Tax=Maricaulis sp. TaxID=1486257 RepID=UPI00260868D8|nr:arylformamidase [Maricaulis sp.]